MRELVTVQVNHPFLSDRGARSRENQDSTAKTYLGGSTHLTFLWAEDTSSDRGAISLVLPRQSRGLASGRFGEINRRRGWPCVAPCIRPS